MDSYKIWLGIGFLLAVATAFAGWRTAVAKADRDSESARTRASEAETDSKNRENEANRRIAQAARAMAAAANFHAATEEANRILNAPLPQIPTRPPHADLTPAESEAYEKGLRDDPDRLILEMERDARIRNAENLSLERAISINNEIRPQIDVVIDQLVRKVKLMVDRDRIPKETRFGEIKLPPRVVRTLREGVVDSIAPQFVVLVIQFTPKVTWTVRVTCGEVDSPRDLLPGVYQQPLAGPSPDKLPWISISEEGTGYNTERGHASFTFDTELKRYVAEGNAVPAKTKQLDHPFSEAVGLVFLSTLQDLGVRLAVKKSAP